MSVSVETGRSFRGLFVFWGISSGVVHASGTIVSVGNMVVLVWCWCLLLSLFLHLLFVNIASSFLIQCPSCGVSKSVLTAGTSELPS